MCVISSRIGLALLLTVALLGLGCGELRGRRKVKVGNSLYKEGRYGEAVRAYEEAEQRVPGLAVLWLNKGIACRQLMIPGAKTPENEAAVACAIQAFQKLRELRPADPRGEQLYVQTLFDADRFDALAVMYRDRVSKNPSDLEAVNGLVQVYSRSNRWEEALEWQRRRADLEPRDAEAQYAVGVFLWQQLAQRGGGQDKATFDPRPDPDKPHEFKQPPLFSEGDIMASQRVMLADLGIAYLEKALALRSKYPEAMTYLNLVYRQKSFAYFARPDQWQTCVDEAQRWQRQAVEAQETTPPHAVGGDLTGPRGSKH